MRVLEPRPIREGDHKLVYQAPVATQKQAFCGHWIDTERQPRANCKQCWTFFFIQNAQQVDQWLHLVATKKQDGVDQLTAQFGSKFVKNLTWFVDKVRQAKAISDEINAELEDKLTKPNEYDIVFKPEGATADIIERPTEEATA